MAAGFDADYQTIKVFLEEMAKSEYYSEFIFSDEYKEKKETCPERKRMHIFLSKKGSIDCCVLPLKRAG